MKTLGREAAKVAVELLNEILRLDPALANSLVSSYHTCNKHIAKHPSIQVISGEHTNLVSVLGILNGLFGVNSINYGHISAVIQDGKPVSFVMTPEEK